MIKRTKLSLSTKAIKKATAVKHTLQRCPPGLVGKKISRLKVF